MLSQLKDIKRKEIIIEVTEMLANLMVAIILQHINVLNNMFYTINFYNVTCKLYVKSKVIKKKSVY